MNKIHIAEILKKDFPYFRKQLLSWNKEKNKRVLPWKNITNPYHIWVSEIMLQQTQAEKVIPYYLNFIQKFPTLTVLAQSDENTIFKLWQGLGYYRRCRNLFESCKQLVNEGKKEIPQEYKELLKLKGIGKYTAAAISSFAFNLPYAVVDGNVIRILSRFWGLKIQRDSLKDIQFVEYLAQELADKKNIKNYNQAIMDLGATICLPKNPLCQFCFLYSKCKAFEDPKKFLVLPAQKKIQKKKRYFDCFFVFTSDKKLLIRKREALDIWQSLFEVVLIESSKNYSIKKSIENFSIKFFKKEKTLLNIYTDYPIFKQTLSHQYIYSRMFVLTISKAQEKSFSDFRKIPLNQRHKYSFPKTILDMFKELDNKKIGIS